MVKFKRGVIVAYRDVLAHIRTIDSEFKDPKVKEIFDYVEERLNTYLNSD